VASLSAEVTDAHTFHEFLLATGRTTDWMNLLVYQVLQQSGFKMSHNTIGCAAAHPVGNSSSHVK
jgi:hypothetical protein